MKLNVVVSAQSMMFQTTSLLQHQQQSTRRNMWTGKLYFESLAYCVLTNLTQSPSCAEYFDYCKQKHLTIRKQVSPQREDFFTAQEEKSQRHERLVLPWAQIKQQFRFKRFCLCASTRNNSSSCVLPLEACRHVYFFFQFDFCLRHKMMTFIHNLSRTCSVVLPAGTRKQLSVTPDIFDLLKNKVRDVMSGRSFSPTWAVFMLSVQQRRSGTFCWRFIRTVKEN